MTVQENPVAVGVEADLIREYTGVAASIISDNLDRMIGAPGILPMHAGGPLIGTALTVQTRHGDNLAIHAALRLARPGDVLVIDGGGDTTQALIGEIIAVHAESIGVAGFVIDGAIRDLGAIRQSSLPVYARAVTHRGPYKNGPGALNVPVAIGGMTVNPGDLIVGDEDGVVALSAETARRILPSVRAQEEKERAKIARFRDTISRMAAQ